MGRGSGAPTAALVLGVAAVGAPEPRQPRLRDLASTRALSLPLAAVAVVGSEALAFHKNKNKAGNMDTETLAFEDDTYGQDGDEGQDQEQGRDSKDAKRTSDMEDDDGGGDEEEDGGVAGGGVAGGVAGAGDEGDADEEDPDEVDHEPEVPEDTLHPITASVLASSSSSVVLPLQPTASTKPAGNATNTTKSSEQAARSALLGVRSSTTTTAPGGSGAPTPTAPPTPTPTAAPTPVTNGVVANGNTNVNTKASVPTVAQLFASAPPASLVRKELQGVEGGGGGGGSGDTKSAKKGSGSSSGRGATSVGDLPPFWELPADLLPLKPGAFVPGSSYKVGRVGPPLPASVKIDKAPAKALERAVEEAKAEHGLDTPLVGLVQLRHVDAPNYWQPLCLHDDAGIVRPLKKDQHPKLAGTKAPSQPGWNELAACGNRDADGNAKYLNEEGYFKHFDLDIRKNKSTDAKRKPTTKKKKEAAAAAVADVGGGGDGDGDVADDGEEESDDPTPKPKPKPTNSKPATKPKAKQADVVDSEDRGGGGGGDSKATSAAKPKPTSTATPTPTPRKPTKPKAKVKTTTPMEVDAGTTTPGAQAPVVVMPVVTAPTTNGVAHHANHAGGASKSDKPQPMDVDARGVGVGVSAAGGSGSEPAPKTSNNNKPASGAPAAALATPKKKRKAADAGLEETKAKREVVAVQDGGSTSSTSRGNNDNSDNNALWNPSQDPHLRALLVQAEAEAAAAQAKVAHLQSRMQPPAKRSKTAAS